LYVSKLEDLEPDRAPARGRRRIELTARDRELLEFLAEHRLVLSDHIQALLGMSPRAADTRLQALAYAGFVTRERVFHRQPPFVQITRAGLAAIASDLPAPRLDLRSYKHDVGLAWLWLAARGGTFGPTHEVIGERRLRSHDASVQGAHRLLGIRLGGVGPRGADRIHYPDLLLVTAEGRRIAVELELSWKGPSRTEKILAGYGADPSIAAVLYLVENRTVGRSVEAAARRMGIQDLIQIQLVSCATADPRAEPGRVAERMRHTPGPQRVRAAPPKITGIER
jgi:DNA-binding MarR family transcriptional regulator